MGQTEAVLQAAEVVDEEVGGKACAFVGLGNRVGFEAFFEKGNDGRGVDGALAGPDGEGER